MWPVVQQGLSLFEVLLRWCDEADAASPMRSGGVHRLLAHALRFFFITVIGAASTDVGSSTRSN